MPSPADITSHPTPRQYIDCTPTDAPLNSRTVESQFRRLHTLSQATSDDRSWYANLFSTPAPPTIEWLLVTDGDPETPLRYYVGVDDPDALDALEQCYRTLVPNEYELTRTEWHPSDLLPTSEPTDHRSDAPTEAATDAADASTDTTQDSSDGDSQPVHAIEFVGVAERRNDWQTRLTPFSTFTDTPETRFPLSAIIEALAGATSPTIYQALCQPLPDWHAEATGRRDRLKRGLDTPAQRFFDGIIPRVDPDQTGRDPEATRLEELDAKDARRSFVVNARVVTHSLHGEGTPRAFDGLSTAFEPVSHTCYSVQSRHHSGDAAHAVLEGLATRTVHPPAYETLTAKLPWTENTSRGIVADPTEAPVFCLLDGSTLTEAGKRALAPTPGERTALPRPPHDILANYRTEGLPLGRPLTQDGITDSQSISLPTALQPLHVGWFGKTGSGKSTSLITAILENHRATAGADILIDPKGDGMATDYLRAHYVEYGSLEDVVYFDCAETLPAFGFFDIRDELDAGVPRTTAVEDATDHYIEILTQIMGKERFEQAVRSPDVIRYMVKALFDPVNGQDAFSHRELHGAVRRMHERQSVPPVSDGDLERMLGGVVANRAQTFDEIMQGVANRMEKVPIDQRLARIFNHVPDDEADRTDPHFDLADHLNQNEVIIIDTGELRSEAQRVLTLVVLSNLWTALRRRTRRGTDDALVNVYVEEAASVAVSDLLKELLAQSRGFNCAMTLAMQFPAQLREADPTAYDEVLNNISTFLTGNVPLDRQLAQRLATDELTPQAVGNRLRALRRGQWLVALPAAFGVDEPRPFTVESLPPPPGDPAGPRQLTRAERAGFTDELADVRERTLGESGLTLGEPSAATQEADAEMEAADPRLRVDSALPHTNRMPPTVEYEGETHALRCTACDNRYDPSIAGMKRAISCCSSLAEVDRDDVPICELNLKLSPDERAASEWSDRQLMFLQAVYNAQQLRYDRLEYDLVADSMIRLQEYVDIGGDPLQDLLDSEYLSHGTDHPHRLYTVTPDGRSVIGESYRQGVDYGHGAGDLEESSEHVLAIEVARRYLEQAYVADADSPVTEVVPYYDMDEQRRLDIAALDESGDVRIAVEAERVNNDIIRAVPDDYDKMADAEPDEAIWVVMTIDDAHDVLAALNEPAEGDPRVEKTYARTTPPQQFSLDTPGLTAIYPVDRLRKRLGEPENS
ncbi:ATP-binding protein [Halorarum salinum]|uniref:ATP-binding protein n=1 Tax=Halorarum salinum TaxID=2743089 RepID=A0A7D5Q9P3_9EURY|nr:ATP-binding protein [Halobaculum salinum]QLG61118.1 ATP-binding protein [Halobaculum salinum]